MSMRVLLAAALCVGLTACVTRVPDSARGVGYSDYDAYLAEQAERQRRLRGDYLASAETPIATPAPATVAPAPTPVVRTAQAVPQPQPVRRIIIPTPAPVQPTQAATTASTAVATLQQTPTPVPAAPQPVLVPTPTFDQPVRTAAAVAPVTQPRVAPPRRSTVVGSGGTISDEQDFTAVSARETIESDRERLAQQRAQYQQIQPTALPTGGSGGANIVAYALQTNHAPGTQIYRRSPSFLQRGNHVRNCAELGSPDIAQEAFLAGGGPSRDRKNLDPDGDGFACGWDPTPFRAAVRR